MWKWFTRWRRRFREVISVQGEPYLVRYRLWSSASLGIYLHHILRSDTDRNLHDHPFDFTTCILWGGYFEHLEYRPVWRGPGCVVRHEADDLHRVELAPGFTAWTLFIRGPRLRKWGFMTPTGWVPHDKYENLGEYSAQT